jgi:2-C-methyl-D-erythritol 2,4-cyclodiphosphate synthase
MKGYRTGIGFDAHQFSAEVPMWLAGLEFPDEPRGLAGHSDGDAACHAACDALLSAAGLGDIGTHFGTADPDWKDAPGVRFLGETVALVEAAGFQVVNVAIQIIGNAPRITPRRAEAEAVLSAAIGAPVAVSGTTTDQLGFTGRGEGVAAIATALIKQHGKPRAQDRFPASSQPIPENG